MSLPEIFTRRPVLSTVLGALILLLGIAGLANLQIREFPDVDESVVTVTTTYPGASAELMQGFVSNPIASIVATADNVDYVTSESRSSSSVVSVNMVLGSNPNDALTEILALVQEVRNDLPEDANDPQVTVGTGQNFATMYLDFQNPQMSATQLNEYLEQVIQPLMTTIEGVGEAEILGGARFAMRVWIDPIRLASRGVTANELAQAIAASNFLSAPGTLETADFRSSILLESTLQTPEEVAQLPLRMEGDRVVRLGDVAEVALDAESFDTIVSVNGEEGVFVGIFPAPGANPLSTSQAVLDALPEIEASLPEGMSVSVTYDATEAIAASIEEVFITILQAVVVVVLVILLFLGSARSVIMPVITIPLSLVGICFFMWMAGFSINLLTLLAMVLAIGLVVDDAIVVVENVQRNIDEGMKPMGAAIIGMREIWVALIATSLALVAVLAPIAFTGGLVGQLFTEFALTLAGAVIISTVVALTITPMLAARLLTAEKSGWLQRFADRNLTRLSNGYARLLERSLGYRPVTGLVVVVLTGLSVFMFLKTPSELAPEEDQGALFAILNAPSYATSQYTARYAEQVFAATNDIEEVDAQFYIIGFGGATNSGFSIWSLKEWGARERSQADVQTEITGRLAAVDGVRAQVFAPPTLPGAGGGLPISVVIRSTADVADVYEVAEEIAAEAQASGRFIVVNNSLSFDTPQTRVSIDRERAAALNVSAREVGDTLSLLVGNAPVGQFDRDGRSYDVIAQVAPEFRDTPERLGEFFIRSMSGQMLSLSALLETRTVAAPSAIEQFDQLNSATIQALPIPTVTTGEGIATITEIAERVMPGDFFIDYADQSRLEVNEGATVLIAFVAALIVIYLVLAANYESFRDPLIILVAVPLTMFGALLPLNLGVATLNIYTQVGLIALIGIIAKHGILLVEFANQARDEGLGIQEAMLRSARQRLRPILMTAISLALAVVPLIIASGAGAAARQSMGIVIFSGLVIGTIFTLFVVPAVYTLIADPVRAKPDAEIDLSRADPAGSSTKD